MDILAEPRVWILDLDETLGHFGMLCILVKIYMHFNNNEFPSPKFTVDNFLSGDDSGFRPGLIELMKLGEYLLDNNLLDEIVIYTSASNHNGWIDYIVKCIEYYCNIKEKTINRVVSSDVSFVPSRDGAGLKDMNYIIYPNTNLNKVIMIDDKTYNIVQNGSIPGIFSVTPYRQFISPWKFLRNCNFWDIEIENKIRDKCNKSDTDKGIFNNLDCEDMKHSVGLSLTAITHDARMYPHEINPVSYKLDNELLLIKNELNKLYNKID